MLMESRDEETIMLNTLAGVASQVIAMVDRQVPK